MSDVALKPARRPSMRTPLDRSPWLLPVFLGIWLFIVIAPLLVLFAYSFFESRNFAMLPSVARNLGKPLYVGALRGDRANPPYRDDRHCDRALIGVSLGALASEGRLQ